jgi:GTP-binding protein EngB required for normal cell division
MLRRLLAPQQEALLEEERQLLADLAAALEDCGATPEDREVLRRSGVQLDDLFLLVVAGEFNAGKSAFINALLGSPVLAEGVTPTTTQVQLLRYAAPAETPAPTAPAAGVAPAPPAGAASPAPAATTAPTAIAEADVRVVTAPVELLREIHIVDTPGTNAIHREHEAITREFVPRSDLVLFVTSADRPFTESERAFLQGIRDWGKKIVVVINKIDILASDADVEQVRAFVAQHAAALLGAAPDIFPVSARQAQRAKAAAAATATADPTNPAATGTPGTPDAALLATSRFADLERFITGTLDQAERLRLKLQNPLGVAARLAQRYRDDAAARLALLADDLSTIDDIDRQLALYGEDLGREFRFRLADVALVLSEFEQRGVRFFDDTMRLARVFDLVNKSRIKAEFAAKVVADVPRLIDQRVHEIIDWMVTADLRQWQAVMARIDDRRRRHAERIVGQVGGAFELQRDRLLASVGRAAQDAVDAYDRDHEATHLAADVQAAVTSTALVEVGAIGLGALLAHVLVGAAADATGLLAGGVIAALGLFIIPSRREAAKRDLAAKIESLRSQLMATLTTQFEHETERSQHRIDEAITPYTRFIRAEREHLESTAATLAGLAARLTALSRRVDAL